VKIGPSHLERQGTATRVCADIEVGGEVRTWWIAVQRVHEGLLDLGPAAMLPAATAIAARIGEDLLVEGAVCPKQLAGVRNAAALFAGWWGWRVPTVHAATAELPFVTGHGTGLLFTRGIDSTAALIESMRGPSPRVSHLLSVADLEPNHSPAVAAMVLRDTELAAASVGLPLITLTTNLRAEAERFINWERAFGGVLAGSALALGPLLGTLLISSTLSDDHAGPHGSTAELDAMWSTARTAVHTAQQTLTRVDKAALVCTEPDLARRIKVCWAGDQRGNCGRCTKCLMTMTALAAVGGDDAFQAFDAPLSAEAIRRLVPPRHGIDDLDTPTASGDAAAEVPWPSNMEPMLARIPSERPDLRDAWLDYRARSLYGQRAGLADPDALDLTRSGVDLGVARGWGPGARPLTVAAAARHALCARSPQAEGALRWSLVQRVGNGPTHSAALLTEHWGNGAVMLLDAVTPGVPPRAVRRLLDASSVRCWWSDAPYLEGVPLLEAVSHGCVPFQITTDDRAVALRCELGPEVGSLVLGSVDLERGYPSHEVLERCRRVAVQLVVTGSRERDAAIAAGSTS
jgi:hypothetical protein